MSLINLNSKTKSIKLFMSKNYDLIEDWKFNIERANGIKELYGTQTRYFVNLTLSLVMIYNILYALFNYIFDLKENPIGF